MSSVDLGGIRDMHSPRSKIHFHALLGTKISQVVGWQAPLGNPGYATECKHVELI